MTRVFLLCVFTVIVSSGFCQDCELEVHKERILYDLYGRRIYPIYSIKNSTIKCTNIYSLGQISYNYTEKEYDQFLLITNSNISVINSLELFRFKTIAKIFLNNSHVQKIVPGAFAGLTNLIELYLNDNELTEIPSGVFNTLTPLRVLNLTNNKISKLNPAALVGLSNLKQLLLRNNRLVTLDENFETFSKLEVLDLSQNPLKQFALNNSNLTIDVLLLNETALENFGDLSNVSCKLVDLSNCELLKVNFDYLPKCDKINLSHNNISSIENCANFSSFSLNLANNQIQKIDCSFGHIQEVDLSHNQHLVFENSTFLHPEAVKSLDLSHNSVRNLSKSFFGNMESLQILKLNQNNLSTIPPDLFKDLLELITLDLSENRIKTFQFGVFDNLRKLVTLNISGNQLLNLQQSAFNSLENLEELYFDGNQISSIDAKDLRQHLPKLRIISLDYNFWKCKNLIDIYKFFKVEKVEILSGHSYDVENFHGIACGDAETEMADDNVGVSYQEVADKMQKAIRDGIENSNLNYLFNESFERSKFVQFFDKDYLQSNFFKYINNLKPVATNNESINGIKTAEISALELTPEKSTNASLVINNILLIVILIVLVCILFFHYKNFNKAAAARRVPSASEMELC